MISTREQILESLIEVSVPSSDDFLKIRETLTRMGVPSKDRKTLYQSCHILHKKGRYFLPHFKEMFGLDGRDFDMTDEDYDRRDAIAKTLETWGMLSVVGEPLPEVKPGLLTIITHKDKKLWKLEFKYAIGGDKVKHSSKYATTSMSTSNDDYFVPTSEDISGDQKGNTCSVCGSPQQVPCSVCN